MKSIKIARLLFLAALVIVAILTACPSADSGNADKGGDSVPGPTFKNLGINLAEQKIIVFFNTDISGTPDASKITLKKGSSTLKPTTDYTLAIEKGTLVMTLKVALKTGDKYTVELQGGAVKDAKGKASTANTSSNNKTLTVGVIPAIKPDYLTFRPNSKTVLTLAFNTNIEIVAPAKIRVEVQTGGTGKFTATPATSMVDTTTQTLLKLTLSTPATHNNVYKVKVGAGAIKAKESNLANTGALTSSQTTWSTSPILSAAPYILDNKLVATFNLNIALKNRAMVKVYKNPDGDNDGKEVTLNDRSVDIAVNADNKNLLEITLPAVTAGEVYRLRLEAGAVNEEGKAANANKIIALEDITIGDAPVLDADNDPYLSGQKIIVTFTAPIRILDKNKIKYQLNGTTTTLTATPKVINTNQLEIPLNAPLANAQVYRINLAAGALGGGINKPSVGNIQSGELTVTGPLLRNVKPVFTGKTEFSISFPVDVALVGDGLNINVQKKDDEDDTETDGVDESSFRTVSSRTIEVDDENPVKINITLTDGEKITLYTQVWKVIFPQNTVKTAPGNIPNSVELTTNEVRSTLTDLYSWKEVPPEGSKWSKRTDHTSVVFDPDGSGERIWLLGGYDGKNYLNDVWSSVDGANWTESTPPGEATKDTDGGDGTAANWWTARSGHTSVVFKGKIWVMGGVEDRKDLNDVWSSVDGANWTESTPPNDTDGNTVAKSTSGNNKNWWAARELHTSVVFPLKGNAKKIWVLGGIGNSRYADVWSSADGASWVEESAQVGARNVGWGGRYRHSHASAVFKDKIWVIGGPGSEDTAISVWSSTNGKAWTKSTARLPNDVNSHITVEYDDRLWSLGGGVNQKKSFWSIAPPATVWIAENTLPSYISYTQAVVFKNRIWLLGGRYGGSNTDKVWKMGPGTE